MADNTNFITGNPAHSNTTQDADAYVSPTSEEQLAYLRSIDVTLKDLLKQSKYTSQADARFGLPRRDEFRRDTDVPFRSKWAPPSRYDRGFSRSYRRDPRSVSNKGFFDSFEDSLIEGFLGSDFKDKVKESMSKFADSIGISLKDMPSAAGKALGDTLIRSFKGTSIGRQTFATVDNLKNQAVGWASARVRSVLRDFGYSTDGSATNTEQFTTDSASDASRSATAAASVPRESASGVDVTRKLVELSAESITITAESITIQRVKAEQRAEQVTESQSETAASAESNRATTATSEGVSSGNEIDPLENLDLSYLVDGSGEDFFHRLFGDYANKITEFFNTASLNNLKGKASSFLKDTVATLSTKEGMLGKVGNTLTSMLGGSAAQAGAQTAGTALATQAGSTALAMSAGATTTSLANLAAGAQAAGPALAAIGPYGWAAIAAIGLVTALFVKSLGPAIEGTKVLLDEMHNAANRYQKSREENLKLAQDRLVKDVHSMVEEPFEILKDAAQNVYDVWDRNLRLINATQGYNKTDLQNLMSAYAERLRNEGLTSVVSGSDITDNLAKVLESGLSGKVAEEFAYIATKLNAAIPTQDFFSYSDTYASVAANALARGLSENEAITYANDQLEQFASNVLYASRQVSGGFSTGLRDAENLFSQANKIAQTAKTGDTTEISGVLTAIAAATGAIAPDLTTSMTDAIVEAATGGNSSEIVALRSLAGVNASNTEFLRQVANNPQKIFTSLFRNLADMQNMSNDAYMEVAEGLSTVFGVSMDAFARIDFNYLASAIASMNVNDAALVENMEHLASGQTTLTAEQLKYQQVNKYMIEEGLAYVLDNEVARSIQEHMWDEQLAREMMEAEYGVHLQGAALEFLEGIRQTVDNIVNLLNPLAWMKKVTDMVGTANEAAGQEADIRQLLELGKVGNGTLESLYQLTTRNADLNLTPSIVNLMGGYSAYEAASASRKFAAGLLSPSLLDSRNLLNSQSSLPTLYISAIQSALTSSMSNFNTPDSIYNWGTVGKSTSSILLGDDARGQLLPAIATTVSATTAAAQSQVAAKLENMLSDDYMGKYIKEGKTYDQWAASSKNLGIADFASAIQEAGYTETQLQGYFQSKETEAGTQEAHERYQDEKDFWDRGRQFWIDEKELTSQLISLVGVTNDRLSEIIDNQVLFQEYWKSYRSSWDEYHESSDDHFESSFDYFNLWGEYYEDWTNACKQWTKYFIEHQVYNDAYDYSTVESVKRKERQGSYDAVYALAEALTKNTVDLRDPAVQTNALLSEILLIVNAIMQQNNQTSGGTLSLADTLAGMSLGLIKES